MNICAAYVAPSGNAARAANRLAERMHNLLQHILEAPVLVLGDFNLLNVALALTKSWINALGT